MRYMTWSINLTAYFDGTWGVGIVRREFTAGHLTQVELEDLHQVPYSKLRHTLAQCTDAAIRRATKHRDLTYGSGPEAQDSDPLF